MTLQKTIPALLILSGTTVLSAQPAQQEVERPGGLILTRAYRQPDVPPISLHNSDRMTTLIRGGKLYLTVADAIALAIENNLDLEVSRYGPVSAEWNLERQEAGGPLRGVTAGNSLVNQATSGQGVAGSQASAGVGGGGGGGGGGSSNVVVSQIGPVTPNLDPVFQNATAFIHQSVPQSNTVQSQTNALIETKHVINSFVQEGLLSGGIVQIAANESYLKENARTDILNPSVAPVVQVLVRHQFLQGFGTGVNGRFIRVARKQVGAAAETFRSQLINLIANVLNLYWGLEAAGEELQVRQQALDSAQKFLDDTKKQIGLGVIAKFQIFRAEADVSARKQDLDIAQASLHQQENLLKNMLSRNGLEDPLLDAAGVVTLDSVQIPAQDDLPGLRDLLARALAKRPDIKISDINDETQQISAIGTANGVLPILQGIASTTDVGLAGAQNPQAPPADPYFVGGLGTALGQVFRRNFYSRRGAVGFQGTIGNHVAQGDYGIDQLQLRQGDLVTRRDRNQLVVDISNQMVALRQARARYSQAVDSRKLQEELLEKERQMFSFGTATISDVVASQSAVVAARLTEVVARSAYSRARVALDQVLGETLETNHVSVDEARNGRVQRESKAK